MKIMIVDDSPFMTLVCRQALEKAGYDIVGEAYDGKEAIEKAISLKPDVVVMDIALPKVNGFEASKKILESAPGTFILVISAIDEDWVQENSALAGCSGFLAKPFDASALIEKVDGLKSSVEGLRYG